MSNTSGRFEAGAAKRDITPPPGIDLTGFVARTGPNTGVLDRLWAKALVFRWDGGSASQSAAIVALDVLGLSAESVRELRGRIERASGIPGSNVLFGASHTHAGPATQALRRCGEIDSQYVAAFHDAVVDAVGEAARQAVPARIAWASRVATNLDPFVANRRVPGGPRDLRLVTGLVERVADGAAIGAIFRFTCHPVALGSANRLVSRDWPGYACDALEAALGGAPALYLNGPAGNINPVGERGVESAKSVGEAVGREAVALIQGIRRGDRRAGKGVATSSEARRGSGKAPIAVLSVAVALPMERVPEAGELTGLVERHLRRAAEIEQAGAPGAWEAKAERVVAEWAEDALRAGLAGKVPPDCTAEVQAVRLSDVTLVGLPGESFVEIGVELERIFGPAVVPLGYTNCNVGYIPWPDAYPQGGYEVDVAYRYYGYPSAFAPSAAANVVAAASEAVRGVGGGL